VYLCLSENQYWLNINTLQNSNAAPQRWCVSVTLGGSLASGREGREARLMRNAKLFFVFCKNIEVKDESDQPHHVLLCFCNCKGNIDFYIK